MCRVKEYFTEDKLEKIEDELGYGYREEEDDEEYYNADYDDIY